MKRASFLLAALLAFAWPAQAQSIDPIARGMAARGNIKSGTTPIVGCLNGQFIYNDSGVVGCSASGATLAFPQAVTGGIPGGIPYLSSSTTMGSSAALAANALVIGGGAGSAPSTTATAAGALTFLGTPSSANLRALLSDESGTGAAYFQGGDAGTPSAIGLTNGTGLPISTGVSGLGTGTATALAVNAGSAGAFVRNNAPETISGALTLTGGVTVSGSSLTVSGNQSAASWGLSGLKIIGGGSTLTDTSAAGTVASGATDVLGGNTIAATNARTLTDYFSLYAKAPVAGTNVTITNKWSLGLEGALRVGGKLWIDGPINFRPTSGSSSAANVDIGYAGVTNYGLWFSGGTNFAVSGSNIAVVNSAGIGVSSGSIIGFSSGDPFSAASDSRFIRNAAGIIGLRGTSTTTPGALNFYTYGASPPAAPSASQGIIYFDTSAGKMRAVALFPSGAAQVMATEP
jgi:hypothetical protein